MLSSPDFFRQLRRSRLGSTGDPSPRALREQYPNQPEDATRFALADAYVDSFEMNQARIEQKVKLLQLTLVLAAIGGIALALHVIFEL